MTGNDLAAYVQAARSTFNLLRNLTRNREPEEPGAPQPPDLSEDIRRLRDDLVASGATESLNTAPVLENPPPTSSGGTVVRPGVDAERLAWQDGIIRGELWLLEGHLKNNCIGCGEDISCCWKHSTNSIDVARETMSMTTDPLYPETVELAERIKPFVHPDDVRAAKYVDKYPAFVIQVSEIRTRFEARVMANARSEITLEEAKAEAARIAAERVQKQWESTEKT